MTKRINRVLLAFLGTVGLVAAWGAATAVPASAASIGITVDCVTDSWQTVIPVTVSPGDTITMIGTDCDWSYSDTQFAPNYASQPGQMAGTPPFVWHLADNAAPGTYYGSETVPHATIMVESLINSCAAVRCGQSFLLTVVAQSTPIPDWVQSYGRTTADDSCRAGWNPTWEQWAHDGAGGWTCTRSMPSLGFSPTD